MDNFSTIDEKALFSRTSLLVGEDALKRISEVNVIVFGVGGVGSWCAESLVRSGVKNLTIVDLDTVAPSNVNRQLQATTQTIGLPKVQVLKQRLETIAINVKITAIQNIYTSENWESYDLPSFDYVVDAIDSLTHKAHLILKTTELGVPLFSSMGAALKLNPQKIAVTEFWKVYGCPLARALRKKFKQNKQYPSKKFLCVYSPELLQNKGDSQNDDKSPVGLDKPITNGTISYITAIFGFTLAGLVIQDIIA